jgi:dipeptidyl aminopeptidase/acylaminoacyl peptidase
MARRIKLEDLWQLKIPSGLAISPDGQRLVYVLPEADPDAGKWREHVFVSSLGGRNGGPVQVTQATGRNVEPRWWPDGKWLAFRSDRRDDRFQVFRIPVELGEAEQLTDVDGQVESYQIAPDGAGLLLRVRDPRSEDDKRRGEIHKDVRIADEGFCYAHLWWLDLSSKKLRRLTRGKFDVSTATLSPDGRYVAFTWSDQPTCDSQYFGTRLEVLNLRTGARRRLASRVGRISMFDPPSFSPDGRLVAFVCNPSADAPLHRVAYVVGRAGGRAKPLAPQLDRPQTLPVFSADGRSVLMVISEGVNSQLVRCQLSDGKCRNIGPSRGVVLSLAAAPGEAKAAFAYSRSDDPWGLFAVRLDGTGRRRVGRINGHFSNIRVVRARIVRYRNQGWPVEAILRVPAGHGPHPMIVHPHGGPQSMSTDIFAPELQLLVDRGYAVLQPNFRGSTGYGKEFVGRIVNDWGDGPMSDIMAGVDWCVAKGIADPKKLGIYGGSYGGYITTWIIGHTRQFRAAVAQCAVTNQISMYGTTDIPSFQQINMDGTPIEQQQRYRTQSPLTYAGDIKTPTLVITGDADERVHPTQSWELYRQLKAAGVRTDLVIYPREPHSVSEPHHRLDNLKRVLDWFDRYLGRR